MVSIVIPTFNRRALISRSLESIFRQTDQNFEIIIVDDGSTDGTDAYLREHFSDARIRYDRLPYNQGVHVARNRGIELAKGDYIILWDSDDDLFPNAIEVERGILDAHPDVGMVSAPLRVNDTDELTGFDRTEAGVIPYGDLLCEQRIRGRKAGVNMFRRSVVGNARFVARYLDFIFFRHMMKRASLYYHPEPLGVYRLLDTDKNSVHFLRQIPNPELSIIRAKHVDAFLEEFGADFEKFCPCRMSGYAYGAALGLLLAGERRRSWKRVRLGLRFEPWNPRFWALGMLAWLPFGPWVLRSILYVARSFLLKMKKTA